MNVKQIALVGLGLALGLGATWQEPVQALPGARSALPLDQVVQFTDVYRLIRSDYVESVPGSKLMANALAGMVGALDAQSVYYDQDAMRSLLAGSADGVGVGLVLALDDGYARVVTPLEGSPAFRAGIKAGDLITRIDSTPVKGLTLEEVNHKLRGAARSRVRLTIARRFDDKPWLVPLEREAAGFVSVSGKFAAPGYAWVRVSHLTENTLAQLAATLTTLHGHDPALKGLVLDLRNDPGGLLPGAIGVAAAFLPPGQQVGSTRGQVASSNEVFYARPQFYGSGSDPLARLAPAFKSVPMVVLINGGTAAGAEIVAAALQDAKRATVMGSRSFGLGSVQTMRSLPNGAALKLTTARYYTPGGAAIERLGVTPTLAVDETAALATPAGEPGRPAARVPLAFGSASDFQLAQALNHLRGAPVQLAASAAAAAPADPAAAAASARAPDGAPRQ